MKTITTTIAILVLSIFAISCSKPDNGIEGAKGETGNANVISSVWKTISAPPVNQTIDGTCVKTKILEAPELTQNIIDSATMIVYFKASNIGPYQLPYISDAGGVTNQINGIFKIGNIIITRHTFSSCRFNSGVAEQYPGEPVMVSLPESLQYRYVFIPKTNASNKNILIDYKKMSYKELSTTLNLKE